MGTVVADAQTQSRQEATARSGSRGRLDSVDLLRGLVMVLMVLDHVRDFLTDVRLDPTDLTRTNAALFFTRWITHFCAPVFIFLAGTGAFLAAARGMSKPELARFLLVRGLLLLVLEQTVVGFALTFQFDLSFIVLNILWAIGWSMIALAGLVLLPTWAVGVVGLLLIAAHNLFDSVRPDDVGSLRELWMVLHVPGVLKPPPGVLVFVMYPLIPWIGVMAAGYAFGPVLLLEATRRRRWLLGLGFSLTALFVLLRAVNVYGDPRPWSVQEHPLFTLLSFLNCQKYPPSLLFLLMTLGPAIAALAWFDRGLGAVGRVLTVFGRVPLFFYIVQWYLAHVLVVALALVLQEPTGWLFQSPPFQSPKDYGYSLPVVYLVWVLAVALLYPLCRWFATLKQRRPGGWLSYF